MRQSSPCLLITLAALFIVLMPARTVVAGPADGLSPAVPPLDLSTPRRTMSAFLSAARSGEFLRAAHALDLRAIPRDMQVMEGPRLARKLGYVIDARLPIDLRDLSDTPDGEPGDGVLTERIGVISLSSGVVPINLQRVQLDAVQRGWVLSAGTVAIADRLYTTYGPVWMEARLPRAFSSLQLWGISLWQWIGLCVLMLLSYVAGRILGWVVLTIGSRLVARTITRWDDRLLAALHGPIRHFIGLFLLWALLLPLRLDASSFAVLVQLIEIALIFVTAWLLIRVVHLLALALEERAHEQARDDHAAEHRLRGMRTQLAVMRQVLSILIAVLATAAALLQFSVVRNVGVSLLASAGIAGVVVGFAAQRTLATLLGGIQLSLAQSVRIGDSVIIEGEWGQVEQINLTYVVVKIWDERRLVVPTDRFLDKPFQNLSLISSELTGAVMIHADYRLPVDAVRAEVERLLDGNQLWDGRSHRVQVTEAGEHTMQVRVVVTAADADLLWDLRCQLREGLLAWLRDFEGGRYLPLLRVTPPVMAVP